MTKILGRYIAKITIVATLIAALVILGILSILSLLTELKNVGEGDYGMMQAVIYVLMRLPSELYQFSPLLILLGSIIGLSILSSHRELAVMRASGFSIYRMMSSVLGAALLMILLICIIGEWLAPNLSYKAEIRKENAQNAGEAVVTAAGVWFHVDNNFIHVQQVIGRELMEGVTRYQFDDKHRLQAAYFADTLAFENKKWVMKGVVKTSFYNERTKSQVLAQLPLNLKLNTNLLTVKLVEPSEMSLSKLSRFARYLNQNGLQAAEYQYEFWQRVFQPFASLIMIFLAIPFVLGTLSTSTLGWRIIVGIMAGFVFFISNAFLGELCIVYQLPPILAALLPLVAFVIFGVFSSNRLIRQ